jgi:hypothetical protein
MDPWSASAPSPTPNPSFFLADIRRQIPFKPLQTPIIEIDQFRHMKILPQCPIDLHPIGHDQFLDIQPCGLTGRINEPWGPELFQQPLQLAENLIHVFIEILKIVKLLNIRINLGNVILLDRIKMPVNRIVEGFPHFIQIVYRALDDLLRADPVVRFQSPDLLTNPVDANYQVFLTHLHYRLQGVKLSSDPALPVGLVVVVYALRAETLQARLQTAKICDYFTLVLGASDLWDSKGDTSHCCVGICRERIFLDGKLFGFTEFFGGLGLEI